VNHLRQTVIGLVALLLAFCFCATTSAQDKQASKNDTKKTAKPKIIKYPDAKVWSSAEAAAKEFPGFGFVGEFVRGKRALQITPAGDKFYVSTFQGGLPGAGWDGTPIAHQWLELSDLAARVEGWQQVDRSTEVVGKKPPAGAIVLFDGSNTKHWNNGKIENGFLKAGTRTKQKFQDFRLYFEYLVPLKPEPPISHPHRGNSGVFALGAYEIQIADTFGLDLDPQAWKETELLKPVDTWCGSIYGIRAPKLNMCLPPLTWQSMETEFKAARFEGKTKVSPAVVSVIHNGVKVHERVSLPEGTGGGPSGPRPEVATGPITLQNHGNPNLFRNIWVVVQDSKSKNPESNKPQPAKAQYFDVGEHHAFVFEPPKSSRIDGPMPWVFYAPTFVRANGKRSLPGPEEDWMIQQFHDHGIAIAGIDVGESYGSPNGRAVYQSLYEELTSKRGYAKKCVLLARSRGGLMLYNWAAEHADSVAGVAGIYPVCNLESYPGVDKAAGAYEMTAEQLQAGLAEHNPINRLAPLAKAKVPILHIHGDQDRVVPLEKNSAELASSYRKLGGTVEIEVIKGQGHNMWDGWFQSQKLTDFIVAHALAATQTHAAQRNPKADAEEFFSKRVTPFIKTYCIDCHQNSRPTEAGVNFSPALKHPGHAAFSHQWRKAAARVKAHDMPPEEMEQPSDEERLMFAEWLAKVKYLSPKDPGPFVIRRLTKTEYGNTLHDLFGVDPAIADELPEEVSGEGYLNSLSPLQIEQYLSIAEKVLDQTLAPEGVPPTKVQKRLLGELAIDGGRVAVHKVAKSLARKAYRRPPTESELEVLLNVFDLGKKNKLDDLGAGRLMVKAVLVSPQFLFITPAELDASTSDHEPGSDEIVPLDDHQLASRLSYLLWATMPDDELMELADRGKLHEPKVLKAQVTRLLMDSRSRALFDGFGAQWLGLGDLHERTFDPDKFPQMTAKMRTAMYDEVRLFFENIVRENQSLVRFIDCDYTFLNENLATIYGLQETVTGTEMRKVKLSDGNRGGILGMPGVLAATSFPTRTSAVKRGVWVLEQVLGDHVPSAPPDVPDLAAQDKETATTLTLRERTELHRTNPVCANCHKILDPIGFGLENFDAIGRWRDKDDNGEAIDASGELPGDEFGGVKEFSTPKELKSIIAGRIDDFSRNLVEKLLAYGLCRRLEGYDEIVVDELMRDIAQDEYRMQTLITAVVTSYPFTHRRIGDKSREANPND